MPPITYRKFLTSSRTHQRGKSWSVVWKGKRGEKDEGAEVYGELIQLDVKMFELVPLEHEYMPLFEAVCVRTHCP